VEANLVAAFRWPPPYMTAKFWSEPIVDGMVPENWFSLSSLVGCIVRNQLANSKQQDSSQSYKS